jgi:diguanylate cyclase (GGDEF)-like protein
MASADGCARMRLYARFATGEEMDYGTFFFTNIIMVTVFTVSFCVVAWHHRRVWGMNWFAAAQVVGLVKLILQWFEGRLSIQLSGMAAQELYVVSILLQFMGLRWFIVRAPLKHRWPLAVLGLVLVAYYVLGLNKVPYAANLTNGSIVAICAASTFVLLKHSRRPFRLVAWVTAGVCFSQMSVAAYRAVLTNLAYSRVWLIGNSHTDPRWLYSLAAAAMIAAAMVMCELWLLTTELERELVEQARTDPLTGALNRRAMERFALTESSRCLGEHQPFSMILFDIDNFKYLNDTRGHAAGDTALRQLVQTMRSTLRRDDIVARTGGEEFAILLPNAGADVGVRVAERIRLAVEQMEVRFETGPFRITVSGGVAQLDPEIGFEGMMRGADAAMYSAKEHGRNKIELQQVAGLSTA